MISRPSARFCPKKSKRRLEESFTEESFTVSSDITSEADDTVSLETAEIVNTEFESAKIRRYSARLTRIIVLLFNKLITKQPN